MCGRFALHLANVDAEVHARYPFINARAFRPQGRQRRNREEQDRNEDVDGQGDDEPPVNQPDFFPRYNVAPRSFSLVIRRLLPEEEEAPLDKTVVIQNMKWGLIPSWQRTEGGELKTINARSEALLEDNGGMWSKLKGKKRCVIPVNGYYEWMKKGNHRIPYYTKHKSSSGDKYSPSIFLLAGLYDRTFIQGEEPSPVAEASSSSAETTVHLGKDTMQGPRILYSFTIVTTSSNRQLSFLHDRMPVVLESQEDIEAWLDPSIDWDSKTLGRLLRPYEEEVDCYQVPTEVGKIGTNDPSFVRPVSQRKDGIEAMFLKQKEKAASVSPQKPSRSMKGDEPDLSSAHISTEITPKSEVKQEDSGPIAHASSPQKSKSQTPIKTPFKRKLSRTPEAVSDRLDTLPEESQSSSSTSNALPATPKKRVKIEPSSKKTSPKKQPSSPTKKFKGKAESTPSKSITDFFSKKIS